MSKFIKASVCAFLILCLPAVALPQQLPGTSDPDYQELLAYRLSVPTLQKVVQATRNLAGAIKTDPRYLKEQSLKAEIKKLQEKEELSDADSARLEKLQADVQQLGESAFNQGNAKTLSDMAAAIKKEPMFAKALADANLDAREYAKFLLAYFQAGMIHGMMKSGLVKEVPKDLAAQVNMENVKFVEEHEAEMTAFGKEMEALSGKGEQ